jgi:hypothetical protein
MKRVMRQQRKNFKKRQKYDKIANRSERYVASEKDKNSSEKRCKSNKKQ